MGTVILSAVFGPTAAAAFGNLLEILILGPQLRSIEAETLGVGLGIGVLSHPPGVPMPAQVWGLLA